jgi:membrane protein
MSGVDVRETTPKPADAAEVSRARWTWTAELLERTWRTLPGHSWRRAQDLNLATQTLALAAQQMLCTAPLLVALSAIGHRFGARGVGGLLSRYLGLDPPAAVDVAALFRGSDSVSNTDLTVGLTLALIFATGVAAVQQRGFELIWAQSRAGVLSVVRQVVWVVGLIAYLVVVLYAGREGRRVGQHVHAGSPSGPAVQLVVSLVFYWWSQRLLLSGRVPWRHLLPGAACMAVATTGLVTLSGHVLSGQITDQVTDYGLVGATFVLSVWLVTLSGVIFGGSLLGAVIHERRSLGGARPGGARGVGGRTPA